MAQSIPVLQLMKFGEEQKSYRSQAPSVAAPLLLRAAVPPTPDARWQHSPDGALAFPAAAEGQPVGRDRIPRRKR
ncbi:hypothetical protein E2562_008759 [Oryza meyeriana var. granulata]|uniref:Uncharacterized protein n=1 Tax=Oryza meyeriana var. granulata TaxID=110450 RepID=A0A6G1D027_9ORYZ|nr:hypothetical protein E2562_008759 [Oryza meyeriana var. granulata]